MISNAPFSLTVYTSVLRERIDRALAEYSSLDGGCPRHLQNAMRYSLLAPGKRLRPMLVLMAAESCGGNSENALPSACAVEMIHAYSLVHDDLPAMDDDDLRRSRPTCHKVFGEGVAILAGDALLTLAFAVLAREVRPLDVAARSCAVLAEAAGANALVGGQADDLAGEFSRGELTTLESIHRRKTGALITASLELGALSAGASDQQLQTLRLYGSNLGLAFQITDDLLDVRGDSAALGKGVGKDAGHGKLTFPGILGIEESQRRAGELIDEACAAIESLGPRHEPLAALARYVLERNH
jgi:geranylgeranyl diphosphate synthase type II